MKIALLMSENLLPQEGRREDAFEFDEQEGKMRAAFAQHGLSLESLLWQEAAAKAEEYAAMLPLMAWDYAQGKREAFLAEMKAVSGKTLLLNPVSLLAWNSDKSYLAELYEKGAPVLPSLTVESVTPESIMPAFAEFDTDHLIVKPRIGAGAWQQVEVKQGVSFPPLTECPPSAALVQPFQKNILTEGEYSLLFFNGEFSHALVKRPKAGDYRIQSLYGGVETGITPTKDMLGIAAQILDMLDVPPLYARVDLLRDNVGQMRLIELELVEPYLYLPHAKGEGAENEGAQKLARALKTRF